MYMDTEAVVVTAANTDEFEDEDASFLDNHRHLKRTIQKSTSILWSPCRSFISLLLVLFMTGLSISAVVLLDQRSRQAALTVLRFHQQEAPPPSSRLSTPTVQQQQPQPSNWTFRIMQITDIHLGEDENTDWGPEQDVKTFRLLDKLFTYEEPPDLIVLGGDQLTANNCLHNCTKYYEILGRYLTMQGIPWATVLGNHDDMAFEPQGDKETIPHSYTRRELLAVDESFQLSLTQTGPEDVTGASNYVLNVMAPNDKKTNAAVVQIFFLDSGGGTLPEAVDDSQVQWFRREASLRTDLPAVAFQHIPASGHVYNIDCTGFRGQGVEQIQDKGLVDAMVESGRFHFLAVGHNHGNDYCCPHRKSDDNADNNNGNSVDEHDLYFCFGRHSGYGGYGNWQRGVRMYELMMSPYNDNWSEGEDQGKRGSKRQFRWRTWVSSILLA
ncbi:MAG: hypothetical protein SGILL_002169 [Bacillariaceae sp.]